MEKAEWSPTGLLSSTGTHYILEGDKDAELVVLIHGIGTYSYYFEGFAEHLRKNGKQTLRYDNLGMGHSILPSNAEDPKVWKGNGHVEQLHNLIIELDLQRQGPYVLIGHSMGGAISTLYAAAYPSEVKAIVLLSPAGMMNPWSSKAIGVAALRNVVPSCLLPTIFNSLVKDSTNLDNIRKFGDFINVSCPEAERSALAIQRQHLNNKNAIKALFNCARFFPLWGCHNAVDQVCRGPVHVLVLHGEFDSTVPSSPTVPAWEKALRAKTTNDNTAAAAPKKDNESLKSLTSSSSPLLPRTLSSVKLCRGAHAFFLEFPAESHDRVVSWLRAVNDAEAMFGGKAADQQMLSPKA